MPVSWAACRLSLSRQTLTYTAGIICRYRVQIGTSVKPRENEGWSTLVSRLAA